MQIILCLWVSSCILGKCNATNLLGKTSKDRRKRYMRFLRGRTSDTANGIIYYGQHKYDQNPRNNSTHLLKEKILGKPDELVKNFTSSLEEKKKRATT